MNKLYYLTKKAFFLISLSLSGLFSMAQTPEILYYKFDGTGTTVPNLAANPPSGTTNATIMGSITQGDTGQCAGALIGSGNSASSDYLNTGYATSLTGSWTISMWTSNITASTNLFYIFGDVNASSFRCFTNGVAGANNWILRGPINDVLVTGGATTSPHITTFVYDSTQNNIYAYLDGVLVNTVSQSSGLSITGAGPFKVMGYSTNIGAPPGGLLDEFRIYDHALSAVEVTGLSSTYIYSPLTVNQCDSYTSPGGSQYTVSGLYHDTISNSTGCDSIYQIALTINHATITANASNTITCDNDSVLVYGTGGVSYSWNNNITDSVPFLAVSSTTYIVDGIDSLGCTATDSIAITVLPTTSSILNETAIDSFSLNGMVYTQSGTYTQIIPNSLGCDSVITLNLALDYAGISDISTNSFSIFPNPVNNEFIIKLTDPVDTELIITDLTGQLVAKKEISGTEKKIDISKIKSGTYYILLKNEMKPVKLIKL